MNSIMRNSQNVMNARNSIMQNAQAIRQVQSMYAQYMQNPQAFVQNTLAQNPKIKAQLDAIQNPDAVFEQMLQSYGLTRDEFTKILGGKTI